MPWDFLLIFLFLIVVLPWRGRQRIRRLLALDNVTGSQRLQLYSSTIAFQWTLAALIGWRSLASGLTAADLGFVRFADPLIWVVAAAGASLIAFFHWRNLRRMSALSHPAVERLRALALRIFPRSRGELAAYICLSLTAGICEEFIFRGFVVAALFRAGLSAWLAVVTSSVMFGLVHLYQGRNGSLGTGLLGILFAVVRVAYYSLLPVIVWHAALDVVAGIAGVRFLVKERQDSILNTTGL
jgi:membrane protease YdiL (CAAX protease family)